MTTIATRPDTSTEVGDARLAAAAVFFSIAVIVHNADHVRRGTDVIGRDVFWIGTAALLLEVGVVAVICQRHRLAPLLAAITGTVLAVGYLFVHFLPARSWLSDSFVDHAHATASHVNALSWFAASLEVVGAITLAVVGFGELATRGGRASATWPHPSQRPTRDALRHPLVVGFAITQVVVLVVSFAQF